MLAIPQKRDQTKTVATASGAERAEKSLWQPNDIANKVEVATLVELHSGFDDLGGVEVFVLVGRHCSVEVRHQCGNSEIIGVRIGRPEEVRHRLESKFQPR